MPNLSWIPVRRSPMCISLLCLLAFFFFLLTFLLQRNVCFRRNGLTNKKELFYPIAHHVFFFSDFVLLLIFRELPLELLASFELKNLLFLRVFLLHVLVVGQNCSGFFLQVICFHPLEKYNHDRLIHVLLFYHLCLNILI